MRRQSKKCVWRFEFPDGSSHDASNVDVARAELRSLTCLLTSDRADMRERGKEKLEELARLLAMAIPVDLGIKQRRAVGERTAKAVKRAINAGKDPLSITSDRHLRRIKRRKV